MSVDRLQEKIRKLKNPSVVNFDILPEYIPPQIIESAGSVCNAYRQFSQSLLEALKDTVPAVRFSFDYFALQGVQWLELLQEMLLFAKEQGYYVLLDGVEMLCAQGAEKAAEVFFSRDCQWYFDGLINVSYIGSDGIRPYVSRLSDSGKALFVVARTANKTASETQDLLTGSRLAHIAKTDMINHYAEPWIGRCGYADIALMAAASSADSLRTLRSKYKNLFLLIDGVDYPNANAKNCSYAFDRLGHGAAACAGYCVTAAWKESDQASEYIPAAVAAAERLKKNLTRYVTIL